MRPRPLLLAIAISGLAVGAASAASAATPAVTAQAQQADAAFLAYAPLPAGGAGALCLVDTGVSSNADTAPGLIGSYAIDNGANGDVDPDGHGTLMAMIAGAAGNGMIGAWPQLKIVSVRATSAPSPGQAPTFEFNDYSEAMDYCFNGFASDHIKVVDLALASQIPPTPDQAATFAQSVGQLEGQNVAVVAAAGNNPGAVEEPGAEPNVFSVGAMTAQPGSLSDTPVGSPCSFSATTAVGIMAPGCGLDAASPITDQPLCCEDGTSEAAAFTAAVLAALMSYDPSLSYAKAEDLLVQTANDGNLDVGAAFQADGLGAIVAAGNANTPQPPAAPTTTTTTPATTPPATTPTATTPPSPGAPASSSKKSYPLRVRAVWRHGRIRIELTGRHGRATVDLTLHFKRKTKRVVRRIKRHARSVTILTRRPLSGVVQVRSGHNALSASTPVSV
jgi:hypothetical protein